MPATAVHRLLAARAGAPSTGLKGLAGLAGLVGVAGLVVVPPASAGTTTPSPTSSATTSPTSSSSSPTSSPAPQRVDRNSGRRLRRLTPAESALEAMTPAQRVGQVFMVGTPATAASPVTRAQIGRYHVGNVMLTGRSRSGTRTPARVAATLQAATTPAATRGVRLLVSTDQEGGQVQVLGGPGLAPIPAGLDQGRLRPALLREAAGRWGRALRRAGVNMNLGPTLDTVPGPAAAAANPPIGVYDRQYGYTPDAVADHGTAFARGMADAGVVPTVKHFPGLGRVRENPDVATGVTDPVTGAGDPYLRPFRTAIEAGVPAVMMSTAYYPRLDRDNPAAFSRTVIGDLLRERLGFGGVVVSDDLGDARQVSRFPYGARAVRFLGAGGDLVLTVDPATLPAMQRAVLARARTSPRFHERVEQAALRVLRVKQDRGLLR